MPRHPNRSTALGLLPPSTSSVVLACLFAPFGAVAQSTPDAAAEQLVNGAFDDALTGWNAYPASSVIDGRACIDVPAGSGAYGAGLGQQVPMLEGETYAFSFEALAEPANSSNLRVVVQGGEDIGYREFLPAKKLALTEDPQRFEYTFTAGQDYPDAELTIQQDIDNAAPYRFCVDAVSLTGGAEREIYLPDTGPAVRVNQAGYVPDGPKAATLVSDAPDSQAWSLVDGDGETVLEGGTEPAGIDASSGLGVHLIRFDDFGIEGAGYTLAVGEAASYPFAIRAGLYDPLREQSKTFYYTNRSGIAIDDALASGYGRAAGHVGLAPNLGDLAVPCQNLSDDSQQLYDAPWSCEGVRDVSGGWYDAGDHGKYVVNGGISVAQLMMEYERTLTGAAEPAAYGDGTLSIPESGNGVPDLLDEIRWELEWLMRMQVPEGGEYAGMANHKVADVDWTGLPLMPAADPERRVLYRPSTAATLNLAATAAQGARLYRGIDDAFATALLDSARKAWDAAEAHPALYAPPPDPELDPNPGSGPYDDDDASDEFYWAAAELYLTTGEQAWLDALTASPHHEADVFLPGGFYWKDVAALGRLDLAAVDSELPDRDRVRASVLAGADRHLAAQSDQHFGQAYAPQDGNYVWGSNSVMLNNLQVIGTAWDLSAEPKYADAVLTGMDYLLGRNALNLSYITGWGEVYARNQHSRWYARSLDPSLPNPPVGTVAGGPNSTAVTDTDDPVADAMLEGCVHQFCYVDEIGSWSTNEITVNWNASLSWVSGFLAGLDRDG